MSKQPSGCAALQIKYRQSYGLIFSGKSWMDAGDRHLTGDEHSFRLW